MIRIFERIDATDKFLVECHVDFITAIQNFLNKKYGGEWVYVGNLGTMLGIKLTSPTHAETVRLQYNKAEDFKLNLKNDEGTRKID